jgi:hypothetical protein
MNENIKFEALRCSIFVQRIDFQLDLVNKINRIAPSLKPGVMPIRNDEGKIEGGWTLNDDGNNEKVLFYPHKIDYIKDIHTPYNLDAINSFTKRCSTLFNTILDFSGFLSTRIAFAPKIALYLDPEETSRFRSNIIKHDKFENTLIDDCNTSIVFKVKKEINNKEIMLNFLYKYFTRIDLKNSEKSHGTIINSLYFDINTVSNLDYSFNSSDISSFFDHAAPYCDEFLNFVCDGLQNGKE